MSELVNVLDLVAGVLMGLDLLVPRRLYIALARHIREYIEGLEARGPLSGKSLRVSATVTIAIFLALLGRSMYQDVIKDDVCAAQMAASSATLLAGALLGMVALVTVNQVLLNLKWKRGSSHITRVVKIPTATRIAAISIALATPAILTLGLAPRLLVSFLLGFSFNILLLGLVLGLMPYITRFLALPGNIVARCGLALFVISKIIQVAS